jgi:hypothetical protein
MELTSHKTQTTGRFNQDPVLVALLLLTASLSYGFFSFSELVTSDQVRYALGFNEWLRNGAEPFNYEMSFGYFLALRPFMTWLPTAFWPVFLNGLSSLFGALLLIPLYFLIKSLFQPRAAFLTGLFLIFSPPFWLLTRYGHPAIPALFFFISAMAAINRALGTDRKSPYLWWGLAILLSLMALTVRVDILLSFLAPLGLFFYKKNKQDQTSWLFFSFYILTFLGYGVLKWLVLGYLFPPSGGTVYAHFQERIPDLSFIFKSLIKNAALFLFGFLPVLSLCLAASLFKFFQTGQWKILILIGLWSLPTFVFLPFWGMDFSRLSVPILPPLILSVVCWIDRFRWSRFPYIVSLGVLFLSLVTPVLTGPLLMKAYPFKTIYQGRPITTVPIEPVFSDFFLRKDYLEKQKWVVNQVVKRTDRNVVIISDSPHVPWYEYGLLIDRRASFFPLSPVNKPGEFSLYQTGQNRFYLWVIDWQSNPEKLQSLLENKSFNDHLFHLSPFVEGLQPGALFLEQKEMASLIKENPSFFEHYRQILKPSSE